MGNKPTVLLILDGYGLTKNPERSAIYGNAPYIDQLMRDYPFAEGDASGLPVGLPEGLMGNSEVGHMNMGAGRTIDQSIVRISKEIRSGQFFENEAMNKAIDDCIQKNSNLHLYGLLSDGGVHTLNMHLYAILELAKKRGFDRVYIHCFMDGRDTAPTSGIGYIRELEEKIEEIGVGKIAGLIGRYYAMDRDKKWDRIERAYKNLVLGEGTSVTDCKEALQDFYHQGITDEFMEPITVLEDGKVNVIKDHDSVVFFNFRYDRAREISRVFCDVEFTEFDASARPKDLTYVCFTECDVTIPNKLVAFPEEEVIKNTMAEYLSKLGLKQLHIAETEKYAHVTFYFNGGIEKPYEGEDRILIPSPKVATFDLKPEMSIDEITQNVVEQIERDFYDFIVINFANPDMIGHTGIMEAAVKAIQAVDACTKKVVEKVIGAGGQIFICADHGNAEEMFNDKGEVVTSHTTNKVPFILVNDWKDIKLRENGKLGDIAPTLLEMMGIPLPPEMTGASLIEHI